MSLDLARVSIKEEGEVKAFMTDILEMPALRGEEWDILSPEIVRAVWTRVVEITKDPDPLRKIKAEQNRKALDVYERAREHVRGRGDPFLAALRLAISGNALDAMVDVTEGRSNTRFDDGMTLTGEGAEGLQSRLREAKRVVYLLDNCGEIVFDKLFLEVLQEGHGKDITVVARSLPVLNDATVSEAKSIGLDEVAPVIGNGIAAPFPGTKLSLVSDEVRKLLMAADLIISKGVGNLDSLTEEPELRGRISYLFHGKCRPCCAPRNVPHGTLIVDNL
jgi:hypothetical protein